MGEGQVKFYPYKKGGPKGHSTLSVEFAVSNVHFLVKSVIQECAL